MYPNATGSSRCFRFVPVFPNRLSFPKSFSIQKEQKNQNFMRRVGVHLQGFSHQLPPRHFNSAAHLAKCDNNEGVLVPRGQSNFLLDASV